MNLSQEHRPLTPCIFVIIMELLSSKGDETMGQIHVWTKQYETVLTQLEQFGRYAAKRESILKNEDSQLMRTAYEWLSQKLPQAHRPPDADYPVWLSLMAEGTMLLSPNTVMLELEIDESLITRINVAKWGAINNFSYLPADEADARQHSRLMASYGISDAKACMTQFYPELKQEIVRSWDRLFDDGVQLGSPLSYGLIWELKKEWIKKVSR